MPDFVAPDRQPTVSWLREQSIRPFSGHRELMHVQHDIARFGISDGFRGFAYNRPA